MISSSLTGGSPRRAVLSGKAVGGSRRFRRLSRVGRHGGGFLLEKPLVCHRDFVVSYGWVATAGGSYWKSRWWVNAISSFLTGGSPRRAVLIGKAVGGSTRFRRLLRVGRHGGRFLLEKPLVGQRDFVVSYSGWHAAERDDERTTRQQRDNN